MKTRSSGMGVLLLIAALTLNQGCLSPITSDQEDSSGESDTESDSEPTSLLSAEDGGYDSEDETEENFGFGDEWDEEEEADVGEEENDAEVADEAEDQGQDSAEDRDVYLVHLIWGDLSDHNWGDMKRRGRDFDRDDSFIDWTGELIIDGEGELLVHKKILFDRHDQLIRDGDIQTITWESYTGPHIDGLLVKVFVPAGDTSGTLIFDTAEYYLEIPVADLDHYNEIHEDHLAITALKATDDSCPSGFLVGKYFDRPNGHGGIFRGRALNEDGDPTGHVRGHYGVNEDEEPVFFAKFITKHRRFKGIISGTYADGSFAGEWQDRDGQIDGSVSGKYVVGTGEDAGFFQALWDGSCEVESDDVGDDGTEGDDEGSDEAQDDGDDDNESDDDSAEDEDAEQDSDEDGADDVL